MKIFETWDYLTLIALCCFFTLFLASVVMGEPTGFGDKIDQIIQDKIGPIRQIIKGDYIVEQREKEPIKIINNKREEYLCIGKCTTTTTQPLKG